MTSLRLDATYTAAAGTSGTMRLRLVNAGPAAVAGFRLAFTSVVPLTPLDGAAVRLVTRISGFHEVAPPDGLSLAPGAIWELGAFACGHRPGHANDGPASAFVTFADGSTRPVGAGVTGRAARVAGEAPPPLCHAGGAGAAQWAIAAAVERRLYPDGPAVLAEAGAPVSTHVDERLPAESFRITGDGHALDVAAASPVALQRALMALVDHRRDPAPVSAAPGDGAVRRGLSAHLTELETRRHVAVAAVHGWRGLHIDLARQFLPAADVEHLIDLAAWRGLNRLHLHLTDDEGWRVPVDGYPALSSVGAFRGAGLPIPPLLGSPAEPYGGSYSPAEIGGWVARAGDLGVELVPEIDVPAHCFAALAAVPELVDRADSAPAVSVQHFTGNVLNPGVAATWPFLETVFGAVADLFPGRWLHAGGDEVPAGSWAGSPVAQRWGAARRADRGGLEAAFVSEILAVGRRASGRSVAVWQDAADCGAAQPGEAIVVGWRSADDCLRLAQLGHQVVAAPAQAYYLDMAADRGWFVPGASWAGHTSVADVAAFDPTAGWPPAARSALVGVQICLWTEHVHDLATLHRLLLPRLDAFAATAWRSAPVT